MDSKLLIDNPTDPSLTSLIKTFYFETLVERINLIESLNNKWMKMILLFGPLEFIDFIKTPILVISLIVQCFNAKEQCSIGYLSTYSDENCEVVKTYAPIFTIIISSIISMVLLIIDSFLFYRSFIKIDQVLKYEVEKDVESELMKASLENLLLSYCNLLVQMFSLLYTELTLLGGINCILMFFFFPFTLLSIIIKIVYRCDCRNLFRLLKYAFVTLFINVIIALPMVFSIKQNYYVVNSNCTVVNLDDFLDNLDDFLDIKTCQIVGNCLTACNITS
jgi:hypothetical protein